MTIQDLGSLGELIAAIATVATLGYLATQIRLGNRLARHGFEVRHTPFGWSLQWTMSVEGHGYAKTFKSL